MTGSGLGLRKPDVSIVHINYLLSRPAGLHERLPCAILAHVIYKLGSRGIEPIEQLESAAVASTECRLDYTKDKEYRPSMITNEVQEDCDRMSPGDDLRLPESCVMMFQVHQRCFLT